jgi:hypothetical protein
MTRLHRFISFTLTLVFSLSFSFSQNVNQTIRYDDYIYDPLIKTVRLYRPEFEFSMPLIDFGSDQKLLLSFDDLLGDYRQFFYTIELCDAWWQPVNMIQADYINGFYTDEIIDYRFSGNTRIPYVHYQLSFPNENLMPTRSGNYIMKVWSVAPEGNVMSFTKRFYIFEGKVAVDASVTAGTLIETRWYKQEIDFTIDKLNLNIINPNSNLKVVILQNNRWSNGIFNLQPRIIRGNIFDYDYNGENAFDGGNEFRNFDMKSMKYRTAEIDGIRLIGGDYHVFLTPDVSRNFQRHLQRSDINGRFLIKTDDAANSDTDAEYVFVYFTLMYDVPRTDGDVYISGEFTNRQLSDEYKMVYNYERRAYELTLMLKQGFYDYEYLFLPQGKVVADYTEFEGRHFETENEYSIWVYYRQPGEFHDELIGVKFLNSRK